MDQDFFSTYVIPAETIEQIKRTACAEFIRLQPKNSKLDRLCQYGGYLIRGFDQPIEVENYKREYADHCRGDLSAECNTIHQFVMRHITERTRKKYFPQD